jgi:hypothetical protein
MRFIGNYAVDLPTLGLHVEPNEEIDVDDDFENAMFVEVPKVSKKTKEES